MKTDKIKMHITSFRNIFLHLSFTVIAILLLIAAILFSPVTSVSSFAADSNHTDEKAIFDDTNYNESYYDAEDYSEIYHNDSRIFRLNNETGYRAILEDDAGLLTSDEEISLIDTMMDITEYGNVAFKTVDVNYSSASDFASSYYHELFGDTESGTLFLIDMDNRMLYIFSDGDIYKIVTKGRANTITDNIYRYASNGDYFTCSKEAFSQINTILNGNEIAQPMKYISNALLAILLALIINFIIIHQVTGLRRAGNDPMIHAAKASFRFTEPEVKFLNETKVYSPVETSSGGGGGGSFGGGGGGGGHSSGGGGGHSF